MRVTPAGEFLVRVQLITKLLLTGVLLTAGSLSTSAQTPETAAPPPSVSSEPVIRQSTPIPNDPAPAKKPKRKAATAPPEEVLAALGKPPSHRCFVRDVMAFYDRTHVRCYNRARGKFNYFAVDTGQPVAETLLSKAWKSMRSGKPLTITYAPASDLNPTNCSAKDCRRLLDVLN